VADLNIDSGVVNPGASVELTINAPAGDYDFNCPIPGHTEAGMVGVMHVVAAGNAPTQQATPLPAEASPATEASPAASPAAELPTTFEVSMVDLAFEPAELTIPADVEVTIKLVNNGAAQHQFRIDALNVDSGVVDPGATAEVKFTAPAGEYDFHCPIPGHTEAGMVGKLHAVPSQQGAGGSTSDAAASGPIEVDMVDLAFQPAEITIPADTAVTLTLVNKGVAQHQFRVADLRIDSGVVDPGTTTEVTIEAPAGEYAFNCPIPGHTEAGMTGKLVVK
jgi:uncharacterized cupredoxin-like copper-binding protein